MGSVPQIPMTKVPDSQPSRTDRVPCQPCPSGGLNGISAFGFRIGISLALSGQGMIFGLGYNNALRSGEAPAPGSIAYWALHSALIASAVAVVMLLGRPLLQHTAEAIRGKRLSVESLFVLSAFGAFGGSLISTIRGTGSVYYEVVAIVLCVYAIGKQVGLVQRGRVNKAISSFREAFDTVSVEAPDGTRVARKLNQLGEQDLVLVRPGDPIPVDGKILKGGGYVRETTLTGEPAPLSKAVGDSVMAGTWSLDGNFTIAADVSKARTIDRILGLIEAAPQRASSLQAAADKLMLYFVPFVACVSVGTFAGWLLLSDRAWWDGLFNSMAVLLVACPCALGLAMPAGIWGGLYYLSQRGIIGRNGHLLDVLADCGAVVFDKTGTLSHFELAPDACQLMPEREERAWLLRAIASLGHESHHPVSAILATLAEPSEPVTGIHVYPGKGLGAHVGGRDLLVGEAQLLTEKGVELPPVIEKSGKPVLVALDGTYAGVVFLRENLRPEAEATIEALISMGCSCHILSGDPLPERSHIGGVEVKAGLTPEEKAGVVDSLRVDYPRILFIGDGINDLPAMQACDASLAIDLGAALAAEFSDGLLVGGRVGVLPGAIRHSRRLKKSLRGNLHFAVAYNLAGMALAAAGMLHPVVAALLMVGSSAVVSFRALKVAGSGE